MGAGRLPLLGRIRGQGSRTAGVDPGIIDGLAQTEGYARALLSIHPGATDEVVTRA